MIRADGETANVRLVCGFERPSIERLLQFYIYDVSELDARFRRPGVRRSGQLCAVSGP
jgi:hypothetical protein